MLVQTRLEFERVDVEMRAVKERVWGCSVLLKPQHASLHLYHVRPLGYPVENRRQRQFYDHGVLQEVASESDVLCGEEVG